MFSTPAPRLVGGLLLVGSLAGCGLFAGSVPAEWMLRAPPDGRELHLRVGIGVPCNELRPVDVQETADVVTITTSVRLARGGCDDMFDVEDIDVVLDEPLGARQLRGCTAPAEADAIRLDVPNPHCRRVDG